MEEFHPGFAMPPGTDLVILQEQEGREGVPVLVPRSKPRGSLFPAPGCIVIEGVDRAQLPLAVKQEETWSEEEEDMNADTPVIMEIYSLSGAAPTRAGSCGVLDSVLQEFLAELNELPLPAHWEVLPPRGPDLCITQRSPSSTMASAVIHIQPGLYFHVVVQDVPVPANHELYTAHPLRLTTVDEVVELICNLEAYHLCPGFPGIGGQGSRSPDCDVLVYEGRCQACCLPAPCPHKEWQ
ncbi:uncharacterized protein LOC141548539 isoform X2 [Sminthopsis crassicaudata]|uniref:uncharacterized protein LOC141548539 isoform X2 n=1 Tax=Sminthopsis crassicaudata TaxID=9301 RepID=UPI003D69E252